MTIKKLAANVQDQGVGDYTKQALQIYGSHVLGERALADWRDGLKPVQRRILYAMHQIGAASDKAHKKSAKVVGQTMAELHPHGDSAIYETLINMVHDRYPLIDGHGNFGGPLFEHAAQRYTEARLSKFAETCFDDIEVTSWTQNYSATMQEPLVLPTKVPLLLLNGSSGIGVGISAGFPAHNLTEVVEALLALLKNPSLSIPQLLKHIHGPDAGEGILVSEKADLETLYTTGKGSLKFRCTYEFEEAKDHQVLRLTSLCPGFNLQNFLDACATLANDKLIHYCENNTSGDNGFLIQIGFSDPSVITERVTPLLTKNQSYQFWAVKHDGQPNINLKLFNLKELLQEFIDFRRHIETVSLQKQLDNHTKSFAHVQALQVGHTHLDQVYKVLQAKHTTKEAACKALAASLRVSEAQASTILETSVWTLSKSHQAKVDEAQANITAVEAKLQDIDACVADSLKSMLAFGDERKTLLQVAEPVLASSSVSTLVMARSNGLINRDTEVDTRSRFFYDHVLPCAGRVGIIDVKGKLHQRNTSYFNNEETKLEIVGLISGDDKALVLVDTQGLGGCITNGAFDGQVLIRTNNNIVCACGVADSDSVVWIDADHNGFVQPFEALVASRRNVIAKKVDKLSGHTTGVFRLKQGWKLFDGKGPVKVTKHNTFWFDTKLVVMGENNYVLTSAGKRLVLDQKAAVKLYQNGELQRIIAI